MNEIKKFNSMNSLFLMGRPRNTEAGFIITTTEQHSPDHPALDMKLIILWIAAAAAIRCPYNQYPWPENNPTKCCDSCPPGTHMLNYRWGEDCMDTSRNCIGCGTGTFKDTYNTEFQCATCAECPVNRHKLVSKACTAQSDTRCTCRPDYTCVGPQCANCMTCPPGKYMIDPKLGFGCRNCPAGSFMGRNNVELSCNICTTCPPNAEIIASCTSQYDTICKDRCPSGMWWDGESCNRYQPCSPGRHPQKTKSGIACLLCSRGSWNEGNNALCLPQRTCPTGELSVFGMVEPWFNRVCSGSDAVITCPPVIHPTETRGYSVRHADDVLGVQVCDAITGCKMLMATAEIMPLGEGVFKLLPSSKLSRQDLACASSRQFPPPHLQTEWTYLGNRTGGDWLRRMFVTMMYEFMSLEDIKAVCKNVTGSPGTACSGGTAVHKLFVWLSGASDEAIFGFAKTIDDLGTGYYGLAKIFEYYTRLVAVVLPPPFIVEYPKQGDAPIDIVPVEPIPEKPTNEPTVPTPEPISVGCMLWDHNGAAPGEVCCKACHPGNKMVKPCGPKPSELCSLCGNGTYSENADLKPSCKRCMDCVGATEPFSPCLGNRDTYCKCKQGSCANPHCNRCV